MSDEDLAPIGMRIDGPGIEDMKFTSESPDIITPDSWRTHFLLADTATQLRIAKHVIESSQQAGICFQMNHASLEAELNWTRTELSKARKDAK